MSSVTSASEARKLIENSLEAISGKPLLVHRDPNIAGHATIKIASEDAPAHLLRYKPEFESELPYLSAFQCGLALRSIQAKTVNRFDLASTPAVGQGVKHLITEHLLKTSTNIFDSRLRRENYVFLRTQANFEKCAESAYNRWGWIQCKLR